MGNVKFIEKAVESLAPVELTEFRRWFAEFDATALKPQSIYSDPIDSLDAPLQSHSGLPSKLSRMMEACGNPRKQTVVSPLLLAPPSFG